MSGHVLQMLAVAAVISVGSAGVGCAAQAPEDEQTSEANGTGDLDIGEVEGAASNWGDATKCKPIPKVEALKSPEIIISLDGLTLHLRDRAGTYDRVFPIGPGAIENGKSLTPIGTFYTGSTTTEVKDGTWGYNYACRIWHTSTDGSEAGKKIPVFAGLPFIRLAGPPTAGYGIHGPIDNYSAPNGGSLRRGFVSHGCLRMQAADIVEVYARLLGKARTPVKIQQEVERTVDGDAIDLAQKWIGAECEADADCNYDGGICFRRAAYGVGTCSKRCTKACPDRAGEASTFCVADDRPGVVSAGVCVPQATTTFTDRCDRYAGRLKLSTAVARPDRSATADVCRP